MCVKIYQMYFYFPSYSVANDKSKKIVAYNLKINEIIYSIYRGRFIGGKNKTKNKNKMPTILFFDVTQSTELRGHGQYDRPRTVAQLRQHRSVVQRAGQRGPLVD